MRLTIFKTIILLNIAYGVAAQSYRAKYRKICGQQSSIGRIVGGKKTHVGEYPWIARVGLKTDNIPQPLFNCGGSLITDLHVLTAEHCLHDIIIDRLLKYMIVGLGYYHTQSSNESCVDTACADAPVVYKVANVYLHSLSVKDLHNDITILKLDKRVVFTNFISPICLPDHISARQLIGKSAIAIGFGLINSRTRRLPKTLQKITIHIKPFSECKMFDEASGKGQICAGSSSKDSCDGDSGGPLFKLMMDMQKPRYTQIGITSYGANKCENSWPAIYVDVHFYLNWIDSFLDN